MTFRVHSAVVAGREHVLEGRNCQDAVGTLVCEYRGQPAVVGVVADGCSGGRYAEVGAQLAVRFVLEEVRRQLKGMDDVLDNGKVEGTRVDELEGVVQRVYEGLVGFLRGVVKLNGFTKMQDVVAYVQEYLLFTVMGCVVTGERAMVFTAGDGVVVLNGRRYILDQQNQPLYVGYHVLQGSALKDEGRWLPTKFEVLQLGEGEALERLAIGSDAWVEEEALLEEIWGNRGRAELQMRLNKWSNAKHLRDDASLIVIERQGMIAERIERRGIADEKFEQRGMMNEKKAGMVKVDEELGEGMKLCIPQ